MTFFTEDEDTINQNNQEQENEMVQGAYFPEVTLVTNEVKYNQTVDNWDEVDEDYKDSDHGNGSI